MNAKRPGIAALVAVAVIGLTGCGSSGNDQSARAGTTTPTHSTSSPSTVASDTSAPNTTSRTSSSSGGTSTTSTDDMGGMVMIDILDFAYTGATSVKPGQMIMVTNDDPEAHTLTSDAGGLFSVTVPAGGSATFDAPTKPGSYSYHCSFHANMHGSLVVS
jgi:plastocyanin